MKGEFFYTKLIEEINNHTLNPYVFIDFCMNEAVYNELLKYIDEKKLYENLLYNHLMLDFWNELSIFYNEKIIHDIFLYHLTSTIFKYFPFGSENHTFLYVIPHKHILNNKRLFNLLTKQEVEDLINKSPANSFIIFNRFLNNNQLKYLFSHCNSIDYTYLMKTLKNTSDLELNLSPEELQSCNFISTLLYD